MTVGGQGHDHLRIIRKLSAKSNLVLSNNHILPMEYEIFYEDIHLGIYPMLGWTMRAVMTRLFTNSVEDIMYLILQALEVCLYNRLSQNLLTEIPGCLIHPWPWNCASRKDPLRLSSPVLIDFPNVGCISQQLLGRVGSTHAHSRVN